MYHQTELDPTVVSCDSIRDEVTGSVGFQRYVFDTFKNTYLIYLPEN